jgi:hypothetical protein
VETATSVAAPEVPIWPGIHRTDSRVCREVLYRAAERRAADEGRRTGLSRFRRQRSRVRSLLPTGK